MVSTAACFQEVLGSNPGKGENLLISDCVIQNSNLYAAVKNLSETGLVFVVRYCTPIQKCIAVMSLEMKMSRGGGY